MSIAANPTALAAAARNTFSAPSFRMLDLGCHDGFIAAHVARQLGSHAQVHVDGVDLHPRAVETFTRRVREAGATGEARYGRAEDAWRLFPEHSYDAVVMYELIEHAPDPAGLLEAAERMVKPGGLVYVSTPDGTFGEGGNPHHLHAFRAQDLADLLRRRGILEDMTVGQDGLSVASYRPQPRDRGTCHIYTGPNWMKWSPMDMLTKGLGGSETAACRLAAALSGMGWTVTVYGEMDPVVYEQVLYKPHHTFDPLEPCDLLIVSRMPETFLRPHRARRAMLWMHDTDYGQRLNGATATGVDDILTLSVWHREHVANNYPQLAERVRVIRNGVDLDRFQDRTAARVKRVLYTSSPDRGLDVLLRLWPQVRARVPDAEFAACYSPVYSIIADQDPRIGEFRDEIRRLAEQPGVTLLPAQSQPDLAKLMLESTVWAHPSYCTPVGAPFHETSCIGAMEAQAAGLHLVASNWGALSETVKVGALVDGDPMSSRWLQGFVDEIVRGLEDPEVQAHAQTEAPLAVRDNGWGGVARMLDGLVPAR